MQQMNFIYNSFFSHSTSFPLIYLFLPVVILKTPIMDWLTVKIALQQIILWDSKTMWEAK